MHVDDRRPVHLHRERGGQDEGVQRVRGQPGSYRVIGGAPDARLERHRVRGRFLGHIAGAAGPRDEDGLVRISKDFGSGIERESELLPVIPAEGDDPVADHLLKGDSGRGMAHPVIAGRT